MRWSACVVGMMLLANAACDKKDDGGATSGTASAGSGTGTGMPVSSATAVDAAVAEEAGAKAPAIPMPERPVPKPQTMVGSGMPIDVQQKAVVYMVAMRAPHLDDAAADNDYAKGLAEKLRPIALSMDSGGNKAQMNRVEVVANGRQLDILMSAGCDEKTPLRAVVTRAGVSFATLVSHGMLVVRCNDSKIQCLQSTRDPDDVLCTTAPRHK